MSHEAEIDKLLRSEEVVIFHSSVTDLADLDEQLEQSGRSWRAIELGMGSADNRDFFAALKARTGLKTLPQIFIDGRFVGGLRATQALLAKKASASVAAKWMGYLGLLPFLFGAIGLWLGLTWLAPVLIAYGAVILSFVGAIYWGLAMAQPRARASIYYAAVLPALVGWVALLAPKIISLPLLAAAFVGWRIWEQTAPGVILPGWFETLRTVLTAGAAICLFAGWLVLLPFIGRG